MAHQIRSFVLRVATNVEWYHLMVLGLMLGVAIQGAPIGGGGGTG